MASIASPRASRLSRGWKKQGWSRRSSRIRIAVPHGDRSNVVIEPFLTDQWYVNAQELAKPAIAAVREGKTKFIPQNWENTYFNWMENIQPWCISRQLWWGHQIPAWYGPKWNTTGDKARLSLRISEDCVQDSELRVAEEEAITASEGILWRTAEDCGRSKSSDQIRTGSSNENSRHSSARRRRPRHLVLLGAVAVLDAGLAGRDAKSSSATIRPRRWSPASTSSSSGSRA